jgi:very-short-patch-repair endonuclease
MASPHPDSHDISANPGPPPEHRSQPHENHALASDLRLTGSVCQFLPVQGRSDSEVARLAGLQHGHIHRQQLYAAGLGRNSVAHRLHTGRFHETFSFVYRLTSSAPSHPGRAMAAALRFRGSALVAALDAAALWQFLDATLRTGPGRPIDVLLVAQSFHPVKGIRVHRTAAIARQDVRWRHGIPVTSPARTLLDLAAIFDDFELEAALAAAFRRRAVRPSQLADVIARNPRTKGVGKLRALLDDNGQPHDTRSGYERRLLALIRDAELPLPVTNVRIGEYMVDMLWPDIKLVVEFDSWGFHSGRTSFETDRLRDQVLSARNHHVMRVTARQIDSAPTALVARLAAIITARRLNQ